MALNKRQGDERFDILEQKIEAHDNKLSNHIANSVTKVDFEKHVSKDEKQTDILIAAIDRLSVGHDKLVAIAEANKDSWQVWFEIHTTTNRLRKFLMWLGGFGMFAGFITWLNIK